MKHKHTSPPDSIADIPHFSYLIPTPTDNCTNSASTLSQHGDLLIFNDLTIFRSSSSRISTRNATRNYSKDLDVLRLGEHEYLCRLVQYFFACYFNIRAQIANIL